ncbi:Uncharacterised protein [Mannheimia haemolytica]|uniref:Uncharacterized protein n=1 Tax=Mannheimia haemolytica TaxID=75985 RepID=A0A378MWZ3_MANHA|nr:Uncharacterised protein [Mannheimia haemolytica]
MSTNDTLIMFAALVLGSQICRFLPEFLPKKVLSSPIFAKIKQNVTSCDYAFIAFNEPKLS